MLRIHLFGQNPYESIYGLESEYISFFAIEYEYNYPWRDMDLSPHAHTKLYFHIQTNEVRVKMADMTAVFGLMPAAVFPSHALIEADSIQVQKVALCWTTVHL